jgi:glycosyltransferase involved in cell wall biosynthesis
LVTNLDRTRYEPIVIFYERHAIIKKFEAVAETIVLDRAAPVRWAAKPRDKRQGLISVPLVVARRFVNFGKNLTTIARHVYFLKQRQIRLVSLNNSVKRHHDWMLAAMLAGVPCLTHERGINPHYTWIDRFFSRRLAVIITMSNWIADHMVQRGVSPANLRTIYDGIDPDRLPVTNPPAVMREQWGIGPDQRVIGMVGNVREWKGQETVVRALIEVAKVRPEVVCVFVGAATAGDQQYQKKLNELIREAGIEANVRFTGYQAHVPDFINMMEFVVHASILPEPFGMVVLEAMAQRKAVVGSRAGGVIEMVVEGVTGYTFPPGDSEDLSQKMLTLLADPQLSKRMGSSGYRRLEDSFTISSYMSQIHTCYTAILGNESVPVAIGQLAGRLQ